LTIATYKTLFTTDYYNYAADVKFPVNSLVKFSGLFYRVSPYKP